RRLVARAVDGGDLVADQPIGEFAEQVDAPVGGGAEFGAIDQRIFDIAITVQIFHERNPRKIGGAQAEGEGIVQLRLQIGLLDVELRSLGGAVIGEVGGEVRREDVVELVIDTEIEALDVEVETVLRTL